MSESGDVIVLRMGPKFEIITTIDTLEDELFVASPVVVGGEIFIRSMKHLYCISDEGEGE